MPIAPDGMNPKTGKTPKKYRKKRALPPGCKRYEDGSVGCKGKLKKTPGAMNAPDMAVQRA